MAKPASCTQAPEEVAKSQYETWMHLGHANTPRVPSKHDRSRLDFITNRTTRASLPVTFRTSVFPVFPPCRVTLRLTLTCFTRVQAIVQVVKILSQSLACLDSLGTVVFCHSVFIFVVLCAFRILREETGKIGLHHTVWRPSWEQAASGGVCDMDLATWNLRTQSKWPAKVQL